MTMETKHTTGTRELAGDAERDDEPRGRVWIACALR